MGITSWLKKLRNEYLRRITYRKYQIGSGFHSGIRVRIWARQKVVIGKNFYIGRDSFIESDVVIGDNVIWANRVALVGRYDHHYQQIGMPIRLASQIRDADYNWLGVDSLTIIEDDVWVGYNTTIMSGVTIQTGSIIAAGSVVTKDVEPYSIYAGVPARKVKDRFNSKEDLKRHIELYGKNFKSK
ncbi:acyltransferase [Mucilaginibacter lacusdianchii]|uniref:acyltransferase n=1 Tax=Mucilaginibacter lacusdianchii TaxID=2684211 RepID=UPI00131BC420|nr:acyltransferase [Mucilaginibacter sp. JXJ CY 39]